MWLLKSLRHFIITALVLLSVGFSLPASAQSPQEEPDHYVQIRLIADKTQVKGGDTIRIGMEQTLYPKWHSYWKNPGDSGIATQIEWALPPGFTVSKLEWPTPLKIPYDPLTNYGYENQVVLLQNLTLPENIGASPFVLNATINLLVCHEICIPETHDVSILFNGEQAAEPDLIAKAESTLPQEVNWESTYGEDKENFIIDIKTQNNIDTAIIAPEEWGGVDNNASAKIKKTKDGFQILQKRGERDLKEFKSFPFVLIDGDKSFRIIATPQTQNAAAAPLPGTNDKKSIGIIEGLALALLGGLILNLMPCVFPVLSMKALSLINLTEKEEKNARSYGLSYTLGILVSFGAIAATLLFLKAGGAQIGWGFQLQNPVVITLLAYLVFLVGLNLSGFFELSMRFGNVGQKLTEQSGNKGAFFTGVLATLVSTPCTAPFMGAAMGFALTQPPVISIMIFLTLGFGLALPYLALCYMPALRSKLPKPGAWMEIFRQFLAFPMFITAVWLIWVLSQQVNGLTIFCTLLSFIAITFTVWLMRVMPEKKGLLKNTVRLILLAAFGFIISTTFFHDKISINNMAIEEAGNWTVFSEEKLYNLLEDTNDPVFVEMTAAWCISCKVNERVAIKTQATEDLFKRKNVQYLKGDWTNRNAEITNFLGRFNRLGVPLYVYYGPADENGKRPEPVLLPQVLTTGIIAEYIQ